MRYADSALVTASAGHIDGEYTSASLSLQGRGDNDTRRAAFHRINMPGGARLLVDTGGVADVPVRSAGHSAIPTASGKTVLPDMNNYFRNSAAIDINKLLENAEARRSVQQLTRQKALSATVSLMCCQDKKPWPLSVWQMAASRRFGAVVVTSADNRELGSSMTVGRCISAALTAGIFLTLRRGGEAACRMTVPELAPGAGAVHPVADLRRRAAIRPRKNRSRLRCRLPRHRLIARSRGNGWNITGERAGTFHT